jgi:hypothetical protein
LARAPASGFLRGRGRGRSPYPGGRWAACHGSPGVPPPRGRLPAAHRAVRAIAGASCLPNGTVPPNLDRGLRAHAVAGPENYEVVGGRGETTTHCGRLDFTCMILAGVADGVYCVIRYDKHKVLMQTWSLEAHLLGFFSASWSCGSSDGRGMSVACEVAEVERKMDRRDHDQA